VSHADRVEQPGPSALVLVVAFRRPRAAGFVAEPRLYASRTPLKEFKPITLKCFINDFSRYAVIGVSSWNTILNRVSSPYTKV
jgi:hypothetical protein